LSFPIRPAEERPPRLLHHKSSLLAIFRFPKDRSMVPLRRGSPSRRLPQPYAKAQEPARHAVASPDCYQMITEAITPVKGKRAKNARFSGIF